MFIVSGQQVILSQLIEDKIETIMEFTPQDKLSVPQRVIPLKNSTAEHVSFLMVARDDLIELIEVKIEGADI